MASNPPSPPVVMILSWQNEKTAIWPKCPAGRPPYSAPCAWAQSSITTMPLWRARRMMASMSAGHPARWTTMTARVRGVRTAAIDFAVMAWLSGSTSAKTGTPPAIGTQDAEATKLRGVTTTSSPGCRPMACRATSSATVPLASAIACRRPSSAAYACSNSRTLLPVQALTFPDRSTATTSLICSSSYWGQMWGDCLTVFVAVSDIHGRLLATLIRNG